MVIHFEQKVVNLLLLYFHSCDATLIKCNNSAILFVLYPKTSLFYYFLFYSNLFTILHKSVWNNEPKKLVHNQCPSMASPNLAIELSRPTNINRKTQQLPSCCLLPPAPYLAPRPFAFIIIPRAIPAI